MTDSGAKSRRTRMLVGFNIAVISLAAVFIAGIGFAETWHLDQGKTWQNVADTPNGKYLMAVAEVKQLISTAQVDEAMEALERLKSDFPQVAGYDLDAFMEAEVLYSRGRWRKAAVAYNKFLATWPNSELYDSAMERKFAIAQAFLNGEKRRALKVFKLRAYDEGAKMMQEIADATADAPIAKRALVSVAGSYERRQLYLDAYDAWAGIPSNWLTGEKVHEVRLKMAQNLHSAYKGPMYDHSSLENARHYYNECKSSPHLEQEHNIDERIQLIDEQLAYKHLTIGQYYERTDSVLAANLYYQMVEQRWPGTVAAGSAAEKLSEKEVQGQSVPPGPKKLKRRMFDAGNRFLDSWFGLKKRKEAEIATTNYEPQTTN